MVACESGEAPWSSMGVSWAIGESRAMGVSAVELMVCARELMLGMVGDERGSASSCLIWRVDML